MPLIPVDEIERAKAHVDSKLLGRGALKGEALDAFMRPLISDVAAGSWAYAIALKPAMKRRCLVDTLWPYTFDVLVLDEDTEHINAAHWLDNNEETKGRWWHTPNGEKRSKITAKQLKYMGVKPGIPDMMIVHPRVIIAQELKRLDGGEVSEDQRKWIETMRAAGIACDIAYGSRHLIENVKRHLKRSAL